MAIREYGRFAFQTACGESRGYAFMCQAFYAAVSKTGKKEK